MHSFINSPWKIGPLKLPHRLIQGPLAGYSCAPFRELFYHFTPPAYAVSEMISACDILNKHAKHSRFLYRSPLEKTLAYQISGHDPEVMAEAAFLLQEHGANLIDINCGCPKTKIRKKGAGSALLDRPLHLIHIVRSVRQAISIPLTVKIRVQGNDEDVVLAQQIEQSGADALIVHGRRVIDDYDVRCNYQQIQKIKQNIQIPVIANGDISNIKSLSEAIAESGCDGFMIARAASGKPWLYQELLNGQTHPVGFSQHRTLFMQHLHGLARLEDEYKAVLQSKSLVRYYFRTYIHDEALQAFYNLKSLDDINAFLEHFDDLVTHFDPHLHLKFDR